MIMLVFLTRHRVLVNTISRLTSYGLILHAIALFADESLLFGQHGRRMG